VPERPFVRLVVTAARRMTGFECDSNVQVSNVKATVDVGVIDIVVFSSDDEVAIFGED